LIKEKKEGGKNHGRFWPFLETEFYKIFIFQRLLPKIKIFSLSDFFDPQNPPNLP
jgi:hypothetical protein